MAGKKQKPLQETRAYQRRQEAILKQKKKRETARKQKEVARQATKVAIQEVAEQAFGEHGLTPARLEALSAVVVGPDGGEVSVTSGRQLKMLINRAREKFMKNAENYIDIHAASTRLALTAGEFDVAARHAEWAIEAFGDDEDRVVTRPLRTAQPQTTPLVVGVNLGGLANRK